ncbi:uncharacterized protein DS421_10g298970 [Arachis hypogaea]|nr:uncharacterized protein DS421_10g298970 [Arachis hypogaea]
MLLDAVGLVQIVIDAISTPSLVPPITLKLVVPLNAGELSPSLRRSHGPAGASSVPPQPLSRLKPVRRCSLSWFSLFRALFKASSFEGALLRRRRAHIEEESSQAPPFPPPLGQAVIRFSAAPLSISHLSYSPRSLSSATLSHATSSISGSVQWQRRQNLEKDNSKKDREAHQACTLSSSKIQILSQFQKFAPLRLYSHRRLPPSSPPSPQSSPLTATVSHSHSLTAKWSSSCVRGLRQNRRRFLSSPPTARSSSPLLVRSPSPPPARSWPVFIIAAAASSWPVLVAAYPSASSPFAALPSGKSSVILFNFLLVKNCKELGYHFVMPYTLSPIVLPSAKVSRWPAFAFLHHLFPPLLKASDDAEPMNHLVAMCSFRRTCGGCQLPSLKLRCHSQWSWPWVHNEGE